MGKKVKDILNYNVLKKVLKCSDHIIAVSEFVKKSYCVAFHFDTNKVSVVHNGIRFSEDVDLFLKKRERSDKIRLLYIGRLIEVKGVRLLLYAVKNLLDTEKRVNLTILGDGPQYNEYVQLAEQLGIKEHVHFEGYQLNKQPFYQKTDIFVYPSIWQEAFGISIVEALAQGMICVASTSGGISEIIEDEKDGFLFTRGRIESLTETILKASEVCNSSRYEVMVENARKKAKQFDINKMINDLQRICKQL